MWRLTVDNNEPSRTSWSLANNRTIVLVCSIQWLVAWSIIGDTLVESAIAGDTRLVPDAEFLFDAGGKFLPIVDLAAGESERFIEVGPATRIRWPTAITRSDTLVYSLNNISESSVIFYDLEANSKTTLWSGPASSFLNYNDATDKFAYVRSDKLYLRSKERLQVEECIVEENVRGPISWNPSGMELLYCTKDDEISILDLNSSTTEVVEKGGWASFSPDGAAIAYRTGSEIRVFNRNNKTTEILQETVLKFPEQTYHWGQLSWSPDGKWIAYAEGFPNFKNCEATIYLVNVAEGKRIEAYKLESCPIGPLLWWRYED